MLFEAAVILGLSGAPHKNPSPGLEIAADEIDQVQVHVEGLGRGRREEAVPVLGAQCVVPDHGVGESQAGDAGLGLHAGLVTQGRGAHVVVLQMGRVEGVGLAVLVRVSPQRTIIILALSQIVRIEVGAVVPREPVGPGDSLQDPTIDEDLVEGFIVILGVPLIIVDDSGRTGQSDPCGSRDLHVAEGVDHKDVRRPHVFQWIHEVVRCEVDRVARVEHRLGKAQEAPHVRALSPVPESSCRGHEPLRPRLLPCRSIID